MLAGVRTAKPSRRHLTGSRHFRLVVSVSLRRRLLREAKRRGLDVTEIVISLIQERLRDLEVQGGLTPAEEFQRAEAWSAWQQLVGNRRPAR